MIMQLDSHVEQANTKSKNVYVNAVANRNDAKVMGNRCPTMKI